MSSGGDEFQTARKFQLGLEGPDMKFHTVPKMFEVTM